MIITIIIKSQIINYNDNNNNDITTNNNNNNNTHNLEQQYTYVIVRVLCAH